MINGMINQTTWHAANTFPSAQGEVLVGLANGLTNKEIARERGCSPKTIDSILSQLREKLYGKLKPHGHRSKIAADAIRNGWLSPLMVLVFIGCTLTGLLNIESSTEIRRTSNRLTARSAVSRMVRGKRSRESQGIDFEFSDMTPESLLAFFDATPVNPNTIAPWTSAARMQRDLLNNSERLKLWRSGYEVMQLAA